MSLLRMMRPSEMSPEELREYRWGTWSSTFKQLLPPLPQGEVEASSEEGIKLTLAKVEKIADAVVELVLRKREEMLE